MTLIDISRDLCAGLQKLAFSDPVACVYNPLIYARAPHEEYLRKFGSSAKEVLFLGMNPGPWGMAQTGVPFGEVGIVAEWLRIGGEVGKPVKEHPRKKVDGFSCRRSEVSGQRLWALIRDTYGEPEHFFRRFFVINYCPLLFLDGEGRNLTPDKLKPAERERLGAQCDEALRRTVTATGAAAVVGIGKYAESRAREALSGLGVTVGGIMHPSPQNPAANRGWREVVLRQFREQAIPFLPLA